MRVKEGRCLVHYKGWSSKWDEWLAIPVDQGQEGVEVCCIFIVLLFVFCSVF